MAVVTFWCGVTLGNNGLMMIADEQRSLRAFYALPTNARYWPLAVCNLLLAARLFMVMVKVKVMVLALLRGAAVSATPGACAGCSAI